MSSRATDERLPHGGREELSPESPAPDGSLDHALRVETLAGLRSATTVTFLVFVVFLGFNLVELPDSARDYVVAHDLGLLALLGAARLALGRGRINPRLAYPLAAAVPILVASNILLTLALVGDVFYTSYVLIVVVVAGYLQLSRLGLALTIAAIFGGWIVAAGPYLSTKALTHHAFALLSAAATAALLHHVRRGAQQSFLAAKARDEATSRTLSRLNAELVETIHAREAAAQAIAQADRNKTLFLANVSHEVRTPLGAIVGLVELLLDTRLEPGQRRSLEMLRRQAEQVTLVVSDILDLSRIEAGHLKLEARSFRLDREVEEGALAFWPLAESKSIELLVDVAPPFSPVVQGDPVRLRQVVTNLVANAIKFTERGFVEVRLSTHREGEELTAILEVRDTGIGIPEEARAMIFEPFTQVDSSHTRKYGGTGLGLAICRRLVEAMGGRLQLESKEKVGTTLKVELRLPIVSEPTEDLPTLGARARVLLRSPELARVVRRQVSAMGLEVVDLEPAPGDPPTLTVVDDDQGEPFAGLSARGLPVLALSELSAGIDPGRAGPHRARDLASAVARRLTHPRSLAPPARARADSGLGEVLAGVRVLLVEDHAVNRSVARSLLELAGAVVEEASDGLAAVAAVSERPRFDAILMDCQLPRLDGYQAARAIRAVEAREGRRPTPIVALTAHAQEGERERVRQAGMDDYLAKPVRGEVLVQLLVALRAAPPPSTPPASRPPLDESFLAPLREIDRTRPGFLAATLELYVKTAAELVAEIEAHVEAGRGALVRPAAHALKGNSATIGATRLAEVCAGLMEVSSSPDAPIPLDDLREEWANARAAVLALGAGPPPG